MAAGMDLQDQPLELLFRGAMRRLASGVALVTTADATGQPFGIAMTAFMSLSMEPPSMLLAINQSASLCRPLLDRGRFALNIMAWDQRDACQAFVTAPGRDRFGTMAWSPADDGIPFIHGAIATILCRVEQAEAFGTHMVVKALVERVQFGEDAAPLAYVNGRYGRVQCDE